MAESNNDVKVIDNSSVPLIQHGSKLDELQAKNTEKISSVLSEKRPVETTSSDSIEIIEAAAVATPKSSMNVEKPDRIDLVTPEPTLNGSKNGSPVNDALEPSQNSIDAVEEGLLPDEIKCTACGKKITLKKKKICKHPKLGVVTCKTCLHFINSNEFTRDEMGIEEYCTWCGDGGNLVCCDFCEKAYCKYCVKRNLGKEFLKALLEADDDIKWKCFCCDKEQIESYRNECDLIVEYIEKCKLKEAPFVSKKTHFDGPTASERKQKLIDLEKEIENEPETHVKLKSSFRSDTNEENDKSSTMKGSKVRAVISKLATTDVQDIVQKIRSDSPVLKDKIETVSSSRGRLRKSVSYNENELQKLAEKQAEVKNEETRLRKKNKKRTVIMLSTDSEGSDEDIVVVTKSGKKKILSKHLLMAAQAALDQKSETKSKKGKNSSDKSNKPDDKQVTKPNKNLASFLRVSLGSNKKTSKDSTSSEEDESDEEEDDKAEDESQSDTSDDMQTLRAVKDRLKKFVPTTVKTDEDGFNIIMDDQQPGPSGVRPRNKMQIRKQQRRRYSSSSDFDSEEEKNLKNHRQKTIRQRQNTVNENVSASSTDSNGDVVNKLDTDVSKGKDKLNKVEVAPDVEINGTDSSSINEDITKTTNIETSETHPTNKTNLSEVTNDSTEQNENQETIINEIDQNNKKSNEVATESAASKSISIAVGIVVKNSMESDKTQSNLKTVESQNNSETIDNVDNSDDVMNNGENNPDENQEENEVEMVSDNSENNSDDNEKTSNQSRKKKSTKKDISSDEEDVEELSDTPSDKDDNKSSAGDSSSSDVVITKKTKRKSKVRKDSNESNKKRKRSSNGSSSDDEDDDVVVNDSKKKKKTGKRKRVRLGFNKSDVDEISSSDENDDDDVEDVKEISSDSESSEGSVIVRRSKRQKNKGKKKKGKGKKKKKGDDESDDDPDTPSKKGRKKIRRILKDHELTEETIHARELEEKRRKRLLERTQAERDEHQHVLEEAEGDFVLERNDNKEALVTVLTDINTHLKPHQRKGIQFMYDCTIETVKSYKKKDPGGGCLLAHCMGLGKTLQVVSYIHTVMTNKNIEMKTFLVVAPLNTVLNWESEFEKWLPVDERIDVHVFSHCNDSKERIQLMRRWHEHGGVLICGYEMYRNLVSFKFIRSRKQKDDITRCLVDPGPQCVVCDEGHVLRNNTSALSKAMNSIKTKRRIVLTGTPLQNNLKEYHVMVDFIKPSLLGTRTEFQNRFVNPIHNGQCSNSTPRDVKIMKQRAHVLYQLLSGCVQRQDYAVLSPFLPQKREYTIFVRLAEKQQKMYKHYLDTFVYKDADGAKWGGNSLFSDFQCLARIWTHPWALQIERERQALRDRYKQDDSIDEFIDDDDVVDTSSSSEDEKQKPWNVDTSSDEEKSEAKRQKRRKKQVNESGLSSDDSNNDGDGDERPSQVKQEQSESDRSTRSSTRATRSSMRTAVKKSNNETNGDDDDDSIEEDKPSPEKVRGSLRSGINFKDSSLNPEKEEEPIEYEKEWYDEFLEESDETDIGQSGKLSLLLEILANAEVVGDKVLVFSQSLTSLDLIETCLGGGSIDGNQLNWCHGVDYFRMDGSTPIHKRKRWSDIFNDPENEKCRLFLISTKAGSLGINMVSANRVIIFDCSWNPSHDVQSVFRVYRFGQEKPVYVYRFIAQGTMEEKVYGRQINKLAVSGRVVDEMQIERHFTDAEIKELYSFKPEPIKEGETPVLPKDPLLAEVLQRQHPKFIVRYHEHDLLLENVQGEELTEEERQQAWKNYEDEKENAVRYTASYANRQAADFQQLYNQQQNNVMARMTNLGTNQAAIRIAPIPANLPPEQRARLQFERDAQVRKLMTEMRTQQSAVQRFAVHSQLNNSGGQPRITLPQSELLRSLPSMNAGQVFNIPGLGNFRVANVRPANSMAQPNSSHVAAAAARPASNVLMRPNYDDIPNGWRSELANIPSSQNRTSQYNNAPK